MLILASSPGDHEARPNDADAAKAMVVAEAARLAEAGLAVMTVLESGARELRLLTGEVFHFGEQTITRIA